MPKSKDLNKSRPVVSYFKHPQKRKLNFAGRALMWLLHRLQHKCQTDAHQAAGPVSHAIRVNGAAKPTATGDSTNTLSAHTVRAHAYMRATSTPAALCLARSAPHLYIYPSWPPVCPSDTYGVYNEHWLTNSQINSSHPGSHSWGVPECNPIDPN